VRTLLDYHGGNRANDPACGMRAFAAKLTRAEIDALAVYCAALAARRRGCCRFRPTREGDPRLAACDRVAERGAETDDWCIVPAVPGPAEIHPADDRNTFWSATMATTRHAFLIHGMWGGPWCWDHFRSRLEAEGFRCVAPTLPFHDMDPRDEPDPRLGRTSLLDYADALAAQIVALGERPVVIAHSMGGLVAQMLAARGLANALVLLAPAAPAGVWAIGPSVVRSFWSIQTTWGYWRKPVRQTFAEASYSMLHLLPAHERRQTYDRFVPESGRAVFEIGLWMFDARHAARVDATKVTCPVLVLAGREDRITPAWALRRVARRYGAVAAYREFEHHAHWLPGEPGWEEVADEVLAWLRLRGPAP
jgi:pimeloyl-ACP methyl ester carboxylesterase